MTWAYDANGRVTTMTDPRGNSSTYTYDAEGQLSETTDRNSRRVSYAYDLRGRQTGETWVSASPAETITSNYNAAGELTSQTDSFALLTFTYDGLSRVLTASTSSAAGQPSVTLTATYDKWGNQVSRADNLASVGLSTYSYDNAQRLTTITQSFGGTSGPQVVFSYDLGNRLTTLAHTTGSGTINSVYAYDNANRLTTLTHKVSGGSSLATYTYGYDAGNRTTSESNAEGAVTYTYDNTNQLTGASGARSEAYTYDANGNRTMSGYTTDTNNRLVASPNTTYTYDAEGNMSAKTDTSNGKVTTYAYDFRNRLTGVTQKSSGGTTLNQATYTYDSQNRRIGTNFNSTQTWIVYDGQNTYADFNSGGTLQNRYLYGPAVDMLLARTDGSGTSAWYLTDKLGTVRDIANTSGTVIFHAAYDSYGKQTSTTGSGGDRYGYTGREYDAITGLQYNRARYYDATVGRWTQLDPIGFDAGDSNLYRYVDNSPIIYSDPTGETLGVSLLAVGIGVGTGVIGGLAGEGVIQTGVWLSGGGFNPNWGRAGFIGGVSGGAMGLVAGGAVDPVGAIMVGGVIRTGVAGAAGGVGSAVATGLWDWWNQSPPSPSTPESQYPDIHGNPPDSPDYISRPSNPPKYDPYSTPYEPGYKAPPLW